MSSAQRLPMELYVTCHLSQGAWMKASADRPTLTALLCALVPPPWLTSLCRSHFPDASGAQQLCPH